MARAGESGRRPDCANQRIAELHNFRKKFGLNPTANRVPRGKEVVMSTINEYLHNQADLIPSGLRTGATIAAAGIATGSLVFCLSILVGSWG